MRVPELGLEGGVKGVRLTDQGRNSRQTEETPPTSARHRNRANWDITKIVMLEKWSGNFWSIRIKDIIILKNVFEECL